MNDFENIISYESLLNSHKRSRCSKQHKKEVIEFELNLSKNLWALHYDLKYKKYKISGYHKFMIYDPKEREIQAIAYRDRIVQHSLCDNFLTPLLEKHLINSNCACRRNKGTDYAIKLLRSFMTKHYKCHKNNGYFIKFDIKKYFPSINHKILIQKLWKIIKNEDIRWLLKILIDSYGDIEGLPMGNQSSQNFALIYLNAVDRFIKENLQVKFYVRYMDDMILLVKNKSEAKVYFDKIFIKIENEKLTVNPKSCLIDVKEGIEFLGWRFMYGKNGKIIQKVKNQSKKRIFYKVKKIRYEILKGIKLQEDASNSLISYKGHLLRGNGWRFYKKICNLL